MPHSETFWETSALFGRAAAFKIMIARFGFTCPEHIRGIVRAGARCAAKHQISVLPLGIFATIGHYVLYQLPRYLDGNCKLPSEGGDPEAYRLRVQLAAQMAVLEIKAALQEEDPDGHVHTFFHYDHNHVVQANGNGESPSPDEFVGLNPRDAEILQHFTSVMVDGSAASNLDVNIGASCAFIERFERMGFKAVYEVCSEEVPAQDGVAANSEFTTPQVAERLLDETGAHTICPNVGTESVTNKETSFDEPTMQAFAEAGIGPRIVIHGFSSLMKLPAATLQKLAPWGAIGFNGFSFMMNEVEPLVMEWCGNVIAGHDDAKGYPIGFSDQVRGDPLYADTGNANVKNSALLDGARDLRIELVAQRVEETLDKIGYAGFAEPHSAKEAQ